VRRERCNRDDKRKRKLAANRFGKGGLKHRAPFVYSLENPRMKGSRSSAWLRIDREAVRPPQWPLGSQSCIILFTYLLGKL